MTTDADWAPLEGFARAVPEVDPTEWMHMSYCEPCGVHLYKHYDTRAYLALDVAGHAFDHVVAVADNRQGWSYVELDPHRCEAFADVASALAEHRSRLVGL